jgi:hypothetical protein
VGGEGDTWVPGFTALPVWPYGTTARRSTLEVLDADAQVVVRVGERFSVGGGSGAPAAGFTDRRCAAVQTWALTGYPDGS